LIYFGGVVLTPVAELSVRIKKFQDSLAANDAAGALILQSTDLYYFSGRIWPAYLYIPASGDPLFLNLHRGEIDALWNWPVVKMDKLSRLEGILRDFGLAASGSIGLELDILPVRFFNRLQEALPGRNFVDAGRLIRQIRAIKSAWEIDVMRSYARKDLDLWAQVPEMIRKARTDLELAAAFEAQAREQGQQGVIRVRGFNQEMSFVCVAAGEQAASLSSYDVPISGAGLNAAFPFSAAGVLLEPGQSITIDFGSCYSAYVLDHTRTFAINYLPDRAWKSFYTAQHIQQELSSLAKPGVSCGELFGQARLMAEKAGVINGFMGTNGGVPFIGHGVGLEVDELPILARGSREVLEEGHVIAIEPKFALPGIGAIAIENCFLVTKGGLEKLTVSPDDLQVINK
jgi:Xaa-Pro dipeptidase